MVARSVNLRPICFMIIHDVKKCGSDNCHNFIINTTCFLLISHDSVAKFSDLYFKYVFIDVIITYLRQGCQNFIFLLFDSFLKNVNKIIIFKRY